MCAHFAYSVRVRKKSSNLSLSHDTKRKARALKLSMRRPSISNVVEALVAEAHDKHFPKPAGDKLQTA